MIDKLFYVIYLLIYVLVKIHKMFMFYVLGPLLNRFFYKNPDPFVRSRPNHTKSNIGLELRDPTHLFSTLCFIT